MRLLFSDQALRDFDQILNHIGEKNPSAAVKWGEDVYKTCSLFESHPEMGERRDELALGIRRFMCRGYALYYRIDEDRQVVKLLRILHPRLDAKQQSFEE